MKVTRHKWTRAMKKAQSARLKKLWALKHKAATSSLIHTPTRVDAVPTRRKSTIPSEVRDIDAIFGRYQRLSGVGKMFVLKQLTTRPEPTSFD